MQNGIGFRVGLLLLALVLAGCGDDDGSISADDGAAGDGAAPGDGDGDGDGDTGVPDTYSFESRFEAGESSVSYSGQIFRHVLIADMKSYLDGLTGSIDTGDFLPAAGDVTGALESFFDFDGAVSGGESIRLSTEPPTLQASYDDISSGKDLAGKIAGNDATGQHRDWTAGMPGWGDGSLSPEALVRQWFDELDALAADRANGTIPEGPGGEPIAAVQVTPEGRDLGQLLQKFLLGAVAFSQGADDYLDDDTEDKGLLSDNTARDEGAPYTPLEHAWDEGFGYFGAARDYADYTDEEIAGKGGRDTYAAGYHDSDGDSAIDLASEYNFGHSQNAGKRDLGAVEPTDFTMQAIEAFIAGRALITAADGALDEETMGALQAERDEALEAWEKAIAATVVHYINETLADMASIGSDDYGFLDHAKHWSEMKGFALSLQFNRRSPMGDDFEMLHALLRDAPALPGDDDLDAYRQDLRDARALLATAYGFADANLGDDNGENGW